MVLSAGAYTPAQPLPGEGTMLQRYAVAAALVTAQITLLLPTPALAGKSFVTRRPEQGPHFHRVNPEQALPQSVTNCSTYVPAYSDIYLFEGGSIPLAINLSIRNTSREHPIYITNIAYFGTQGNLIEAILSTPWKLAPMATATYIIDQHDMRGNFGANFTVDWSLPDNADKPLIETVMAGYRGAKGLSLTSRGIITGDCASR